MEYRSDREPRSLGYEFPDETEAQGYARELDRRFSRGELVGLRVYRVRWSGNYLVEATFSDDAAESRLESARAILGEAGNPVHPEDLEDYKKATGAGGSGNLPEWIKRLFGRG